MTKTNFDKEYVEFRKMERKLDPRELRKKAAVLAVLQDNHKCKRCGWCCMNSETIGLKGEEIPPIAAKLNIKPSEFKRRYVDKQTGPWHILKHDNGKCPFLAKLPDDTYACGIYAVRPMVCRVYPWLCKDTVTETKLPVVAINVKLCSQMVTTFKENQDKVEAKMKEVMGWPL